MSVADVVDPLVRAGLGGDLPVRLRCWDGSEIGPPTAPIQLTFTTPRALRRMLWAPNELGFARAYVSGDVLIEGDIMAGLSAMEKVADPEFGPGVVIDSSTRRALVKAALRLGVAGPPPRPPAEESKLGGLRHSRSRDAKAIAHHYDVGNDFYELVLGPSMTYSCAYYEQEPGPAFGLEDAQQAKCDLVANKLGLKPGMRVLDVGCGWGAFVCNAARNYGVEAVGITLSSEQADYARRRADAEGVGDRVEIRIQDYRDVHDGPSTRLQASACRSTWVRRCCRPTTRTCSHCCVRAADCSTMRSHDAPARPKAFREPRSSIDTSFLTASSSRWP